MLHPNGRLRLSWDVVIALTAIFAGVEIPLRIAGFMAAGTWTHVVDIAITLLYLADIAVKLNTGIVRAGRLEIDRGVVARAYKGHGLLVDVLVGIPAHLLLFTPWKMMWSLRALKLLQVRSLLARLQTAADLEPGLVRVPAFGFGVLMLSHWIACGWSMLVAELGAAKDTDHYVDVLYWSVTTLTTVGYGDITPHTSPAKIYTMAIMFLGVGMYAYIIGTIARLIAEADYARLQHQERTDRVNAFMRSHGLPAAMRLRIRDHLQYLWESRGGFDDARIHEELPEALRTDVAMYLMSDMLQSVEIFKKADEAFLRRVTTKLRSVVYGPGDVVGADGESVIATLGKGTYFGETALLASQPRNATVRATEYCDLYELDRAAFRAALETSPEFASHIERVVAERATESS